MASNPTERWPKKDEYIRTVVDEVARWSAAKGNWAQEERERLRRRRRFRLYATGLFMTVGLATVSIPSFLGNYPDSIGLRTIAREKTPIRESVPGRKQIIEQEQKAEARSRDVELQTPKETTARIETEQARQVAQVLATEQKQAFEHERQRGEALARELISAREEVEALTARVAHFEAEKTLQAAQALAAEQKQALEQERQRSDALSLDLASAREEVEALTSAFAAAIAVRIEVSQTLQAAQALAAEQKEALEQERQRRDTIAHELASAREEVEALTSAFAAAIASRIEVARSVQAAQPSATEAKQVVEQERQRAGGFEEFDTADTGSATILARPVAPMIFVRPADPAPQPDPAPHALPDRAHRAPSDMVAQAPRERMAVRSDPADAWPRAFTRSTPEAPIECLPAALRTVLTDLEKRFGPVTIVSTTNLHTDNHSPGNTRANLHSACKAVDIKTSREPNEVIAYLRLRPEVGGVSTYRNAVVHFDMNANYKPAVSKPEQ
jgi:hypothetical protein